MENLNKENFWNDLEQKAPKAVAKFCKWIDEYKKRIGWDKLFGNDIDAVHYKPVQIKFHDIPKEMQWGIIAQFIMETATELEVEDHPSEDLLSLSAMMEGFTKTFTDLEKELS